LTTRVKTTPLDVRLSTLYIERALYDNYPPFQRDQTWTLPMKKRLIDSILRGFYIPAILVCSVENLFESQKYEVIDGQQRLSTIFEFMNDEFPTMKSNSKEEPGYAPIEPNKLYGQLSPAIKSLFDSYILHFKVLEDVPSQMLGVMFRRLQNQQPLTQAEKLASFTSATTKHAVRLASHNMWDEIYTGKTTRKQRF